MRMKFQNIINLIENDKLIVCIASWFHDTGYLFTTPELHEAKGVELMRDFMKQENQDEDIIKSIEDCIMATRMPVHPNNLLQQILVDADSYHLGTKDFFTTNEQVYQENIHQQGYIGRQDWNKKAIRFLEKHQYFTNFCKEKLHERKKKNIRQLKKELKELNSLMPETAKEKEDKKTDANLTTKGVQTMLRLTSANHMRLSDMADGKANILISVNAIIISVILSVLLRKLQTDAYLTIPTMIFFSIIRLYNCCCYPGDKTQSNRRRFQRSGHCYQEKPTCCFLEIFIKMPFEVYEKIDEDYDGRCRLFV